MDHTEWELAHSVSLSVFFPLLSPHWTVKDSTDAGIVFESPTPHHSCCR